MNNPMWRRAKIAPDGTHHLLDGKPLYAARFDHVFKYHDPGLAPATDATGAFHITPEGQPAYETRFRRAFGFYEGLAAADTGDGWTHVRPDGIPLTMTRYAWCGNFQGGRCTVRDEDGLYHHIDGDGGPLYAERYLYAGDYRDGVAVVRRADDALCVHINEVGGELNGRAFLDLDVFHKGFARARDGSGWFHVNLQGTEAYAGRFAVVEPFYNGIALCEMFDGRRVLLAEDGEIVRVVCCHGGDGAARAGGRS